MIQASEGSSSNRSPEWSSACWFPLKYHTTIGFKHFMSQLTTTREGGSEASKSWTNTPFFATSISL